MAGRGAFISVGKSLEQALQRVKRAEELGYDSVYMTHIAGRDSITVLMAYAAATERIRLGTGVVPIYSRPPATMAQQAATVDEYSAGRMVLGVGVSHQVTVENWFGGHIERPVHGDARVRRDPARDLRRPGPAAGRDLPDALSLHGLAATAGPSDLLGRPLAQHAAPGRARSPTAWCSGSATPNTSARSWCPPSRRDVSEPASRSRASTSWRPCPPP